MRNKTDFIDGYYATFVLLSFQTYRGVIGHNVEAVFVDVLLVGFQGTPRLGHAVGLEHIFAGQFSVHP